MDYQRFRSVRRSKWRFHVGAAICCLLSLASVGCGRTGPRAVPVQGTVTFGGGAWPKPGVLYFTAESSSLSQHPATGEFDLDGALTVTTFKKGDGLLPGKYRIAVECWEVPPQMGSPPTPAKSYVPARYNSPVSSGFTVDVESGQQVVKLNLDVPKK